MNSILTSVKKLLGIDESYEHFDADVIMHINSVLMILCQMGIGPAGGFVIADKSATWQDFLGSDSGNLESAKSYVYMKVRLMFDPPTSNAAVESINKMLSELEWRLYVGGDKTE